MTFAAAFAATLSLAGNWTLTGHGMRGERINLECRVPGGVHAPLLAAGKVFKSGRNPGPYYGQNEIYMQWVGRKNWTFSRDFTVDAALLAKKTVILRLEDVDTFAAIRVNGSLVGRTGDRFQRYEFDVKPFLEPGLNRIEGEFESSEIKGNALADARADKPYFMSNSIWALNMALVRKPACHAGWDWGPSILNTGFFGKVELVAEDDPPVEYVYTEQKFNEDLSHCTLTVFADLADGTTDEKTIEIDNPPLWWPNGAGERRFYEFEFHGVKKRVGLRKLEVLNERTQSKDGKEELSVVFRVNNRRIFMKGANWIPCDAVDEWQTPEKYRQLLESAAAANMNMIRVWGGGQYEKEVFYDLCDELGILIWHDMMESCSVYPADDAFLAEIGRELSHQLRRLRDHASIALWCGDNECLGATWWWTDRNSPETAAYRADWTRRSKYKGEVAAKYDPTRVYWPSSPCCGPGDYGDGWKDDSKGDMHNWDVWHENAPFDRYYSYRPRFCSEFGYQSFPSMEVAETFASREEIEAHGPDFEWHQKNPGGNRRIRETMARYFPPPKDVESELLLSQFQHAMAMKMACDGWRAQRPRCMGTLIWQLNDNWPVASWSMIEYGGRWKPLNHMARRFFAPVSIVAQPTVKRDGAGRTTEVDLKHGRITVINDTTAPIRGEAVAEYWSYDGRLVKTDRFPVTVQADAVADAGAFAAVDGTFLVMNFLAGGRNAAPQNDWHFGFYRDMPLADAEVRIEKVESVRPSTFNVQLSADRPAFYVWANVKGVKGEFDDNAFTLLPGRPRTIVFEGALDTARLTVSHLKSITR